MSTAKILLTSQKFSECFLLNPEGGCAADSAAGMGAVGAGVAGVGAAGVGAAGVGAAGAAAEKGACNIMTPEMHFLSFRIGMIAGQMGGMQTVQDL